MELQNEMTIVNLKHHVVSNSIDKNVLLHTTSKFKNTSKFKKSTSNSITLHALVVFWNYFLTTSQMDISTPGYQLP